MKKNNAVIKILLFAIPVILFITCFMLFSNSKVSANTVGLSEVTKVESVLVKKGDTLSGIANEYAVRYSHVPVSDYLEQIKSLNALSSEHITAGSYILLPNYVD